MMTLKQSTAYTLSVFMFDAADHVTGKTGLTLVITASKAGAAFASISPTVTERGNGWYSVALTTAHTDTLGALALYITGTGADPNPQVAQVSALVLGDLATATALATVDTVVDGIVTDVDAVDTIVRALQAESASPFPMQPFNLAAAITPHDTDNIAGGRLTDAIYVGGAGDVTVVFQDNTTALFTCAAAQTLPVRVKRVDDTGTDATALVALFNV